MSGNVTYLLLEIHGKTLGEVSLGPEREEEHYHLRKSYLLPGWQGMGYDKLFFEAAEDLEDSVKDICPECCPVAGK